MAIIVITTATAPATAPALYGWHDGDRTVRAMPDGRPAGAWRYHGLLSNGVAVLRAPRAGGGWHVALETWAADPHDAEDRMSEAPVVWLSEA